MICPEASNVICYDLHIVCRAVVEICIVTVRLHIFNNFLVIWDKVALDADIMLRLTQNTRSTDGTARHARSILKMPSDLATS